MPQGILIIVTDILLYLLLTNYFGATFWVALIIVFVATPVVFYISSLIIGLLILLYGLLKFVVSSIIEKIKTKKGE